MRLPITIYLNQKIVFDLLAVIEDGFSEMKKIETNQSSAKSIDGGAQAELGYSNLFNFLGINMKGNIQKSSSSGNEQLVAEEKIHTPTSLFAKLLSYLEENNLIKYEMFDIICDINLEEQFKAILPVDLNYFFNKNMSDIIDGEFSIVGKVIRFVSSEEDEPINLLRNSSFSLFKRNVIDTLFNTMNSSMDGQMDIDNFELSITKPAILVNPIAIYT